MLNQLHCLRRGLVASLGESWLRWCSNGWLLIRWQSATVQWTRLTIVITRVQQVKRQYCVFSQNQPNRGIGTLQMTLQFIIDHPMLEECQVFSWSREVLWEARRSCFALVDVVGQLADAVDKLQLRLRHGQLEDGRGDPAAVVTVHEPDEFALIGFARDGPDDLAAGSVPSPEWISLLNKPFNAGLSTSIVNDPQALFFEGVLPFDLLTCRQWTTPRVATRCHQISNQWSVKVSAEVENYFLLTMKHNTNKEH